jgi:sugar phosphate isomerase/epimerase
MIPGQGTLDWQGLKGALEEIRYSRYLTVELYTHWQNPQEAAEQSYAFLNRIFGGL